MHDDKTVTTTIIPALPGWELAIYVRAGESRAARVDYEPIIAWEIERTQRPRINPWDYNVYRHLAPITARRPNIEQVANPWAIKRPDGKFEVLDEGTFGSEQDWIAYEEEQA
jgi:hypothetical protein